MLFKEVTNASAILQLLVDRTLEPECALLNPAVGRCRLTAGCPWIDRRAVQVGPRMTLG
jgi:hypothetical protein